ncbi:cytochrome protein C (macronuclear) [Tetrahymena thermophila SB210]|uniref:Cytochrome protein C n=1 Tax=Tetrahymena thermophila (strain SB210) TaxID=312017 RepID=I7MB18_TETTS|nr:cytochrome protein C [Tetrahymena thermophila SB210]EAS07132.1 cytochrome protein C [Tetrahymena thermophila SB210]|eukprot:XP_001027374.1 cytochrome protein C [Tetrahymena thermophila SB210]
MVYFQAEEKLPPQSQVKVQKENTSQNSEKQLNQDTKKTRRQKLIGYTKWQRRFREKDQFKEEYDIPDGDILNGRELYVKSCCATCHSVDDEYNNALPLEVLYRFKGMFVKSKYAQCSYHWNRNRLYSILWDPNQYFQTDFYLDPIEDSKERADIAEYLVHLKYSTHPPQFWHDR